MQRAEFCKLFLHHLFCIISFALLGNGTMPGSDSPNSGRILHKTLILRFLFKYLSKHCYIVAGLIIKSQTVFFKWTMEIWEELNIELSQGPIVLTACLCVCLEMYNIPNPSFYKKDNGLWLLLCNINIGYLFPNFIVAEEAAQFSLCEWTSMVWVLVTWQHLDAHGSHLAFIHCPAPKRIKKREKA